MKKFLEYLNSIDDRSKDLIITGVEYDYNSNRIVIKAQYTCDTFLDDVRKKLENAIYEYFDKKIAVELKLKKYKATVKINRKIPVAIITKSNLSLKLSA